MPMARYQQAAAACIGKFAPELTFKHIPNTCGQVDACPNGAVLASLLSRCSLGIHVLPRARTKPSANMNGHACIQLGVLGLGHNKDKHPSAELQRRTALIAEQALLQGYKQKHNSTQLQSKPFCRAALCQSYYNHA